MGKPALGYCKAVATICMQTIQKVILAAAESKVGTQAQVCYVPDNRYWCGSVGGMAHCFSVCILAG